MKKMPLGVEQEILISDFLAPAYITSAWGVEYHPVDYFYRSIVSILAKGYDR